MRRIEIHRPLPLGREPRHPRGAERHRHDRRAVPSPMMLSRCGPMRCWSTATIPQQLHRWPWRAQTPSRATHDPPGKRREKAPSLDGAS
jgi:hypothetical protein